jgi:hypothetical protein
MFKALNQGRAARACRRLRRHPISIVWLFSCGALAAGVAGTVASLVILAGILGTEMAIVAHVAGRTYDPLRERSKGKLRRENNG